MAQAHVTPASMFNPLRQLLFITLLAVPLLAMANQSPLAAERTFEAADKAKSGLDRPLSILFKGGSPDLLQQPTPRGHAWGFLARSTAEDPAPQSFIESAIEVSEPSATVSPISPVPEPASYALMLAGLATVVYIVRRRRQE